jgi:hypothetical protein
MNIFHINYHGHTILLEYKITLKKSPNISKILKNAFKNDPPTTLPQCLVTNLPNGFEQCCYKVIDLKYHSTAFPDTKKLTKIN